MKIKDICNDIYFMDNVGSRLVVNDNYSGLLIYDYLLNSSTSINLFEELTIYSSFELDENRILLFCPDNECFIYCDLDSFEKKYVPITDEWQDEIPKKLISLSQSKIKLLTFSNHIMIIDLNNSILKLENSIDLHLLDSTEITKDNCIKFIKVDDTIIFLYEERLEIQNKNYKKINIVGPRGYSFIGMANIDKNIYFGISSMKDEMDSLIIKTDLEELSELDEICYKKVRHH